jgi:signal transduction histidine kinase/CheY-like chemotaxis protein
MLHLHKLSIRQKIISIIIGVSVTSVLGGLVLELYSNIRNSRTELIRNISLNAKLISDFSVAPLLFNDKVEATSILQKISNIPSVLYGQIKTADSGIFAEYYRSGIKDTAGLHTNDFSGKETGKYIFISESVVSNGETIGRVNLIASTEIIRAQTISNIKKATLIFLITLLIAVSLALILERIISGPILELANITKKVQSTGDYTVRVRKKSSDETGLLYDSFNDLLLSLEIRQQERDTAERDLIMERENLEKRVVERTKELNEAKLKAEESDKLKSAFLANMSHEIRTPLNAILGFSNLLSDTSITQTDREEINKMLDISANDLIKLIDDILDVSRIEANQLQITLENCTVNSLLKEIFGVFKQSMRIDAPDSNVKAVLNIPDEDLDFVMKTDRLRLRQILINILNNAVKFTPNGTIELGYFTDEEEARIIFYVRDTGIGIPLAKIDRIFERFTKVADIKTKHYRGTGLGLSIALKLANLLDGDIRVESEENKGSIFYLSMGYNAMLKPFQEQKAVSATGLESSLDGKILLIVEDVEWNYKFLELLLTAYSKAKILWAKDGAEAVSVCKENPGIFLIMMDIQMPVLNGYDATAQIRKFRPEVLIIAQTAYASSDEEEKCLAAGFNGFLPKPIRKEDLFRVFNKIIPMYTHDRL